MDEKIHKRLLDKSIRHSKTKDSKIEKYKSEAEKRGLEFVRKIDDFGVYRFNSCGHVQIIGMANLRRNEFACKECRKDLLKSEAKQQGIMFIKNSTPEYGIYLLNCGHFSEHSFANVRKGKFKCRVCSKRKKTYLYLLLVSTRSKSFLKFGYTSNIKRRLTEYGLHEDANVTLLYRTKPMQWDVTDKIESKVIRHFKQFRLDRADVVDVMTENGYTECFKSEIHYEMVKYIKNEIGDE